MFYRIQELRKKKQNVSSITWFVMIDLHADGGNQTRASTSPQGYYERKRLIFTTKIMEKQKKTRTILLI